MSEVSSFIQRQKPQLAALDITFVTNQKKTDLNFDIRQFIKSEEHTGTTNPGRFF